MARRSFAVLTYVYTARELATGKQIKAELEAANEKAAAGLLMERGLAPIDIKPRAEARGFGSILHRIPTKQKVIFSRQLSTLMNAGLPLVQSLEAVRQQTANKRLKETIDKVITDVEAGSSLSQAMAAHPGVFNNLYVKLVSAGEQSGTLNKSLERLADQQERDAEIISKIRGAMVYPAIVLLVLGLVVTFMLVKVLPAVEQFYSNIPGASLPFVTKLLLAVSHIIVRFWWAMVILFIFFIIMTTRWSRTPEGRSFFDGIKLKLPILGKLYKELYMARFSRIGSTLIAAGLPMIQTLQTTSEAVDNVHVARTIDHATEAVKGGKALSEGLKGQPYFLELVPNMISIGEKSGALQDMLSKVADYYERQLDTTIKNISTIIEPALMVVVGVIAMIVVAAILLPIYSLVGKGFIHS